MKEFDERPKLRLYKIAAFCFGASVASSYLTHMAPDNSAMFYLYGWTTGISFCLSLATLIGAIAGLK